jgi:transcriptional regulator with XRE-family HTH domain
MDATASELVRRIRRFSGLSQRELAAAAGTSGPTIAAYESGVKEPRISTIERLAAAAGCRLHASILRVDRGERARARARRRDLAMASAIAQRVQSDWPRAAAIAKENLERMRAVTGTNRSAVALDEWEAIVERGAAAAVDAITRDDDHHADLRQMHPFADVLDDDERRLVLAALRAHEANA